MRRHALTAAFFMFSSHAVLADHCFSRSYTDAHLSANKDQSVRTIRLRLPEFRSDPGKVWVTFRKSHAEVLAETAAAEAAAAADEPAPTPKEPKLYQTDLTCWAPAAGAPEGAWQCGVECDGGTFTAWQSDNGLLLRTRGGFLVSGVCGEAGDEETPRYVTDINAIVTTFRLDPVDTSECENDG